MLSQNTLVWVGGGAASTVVAAGVVAGALLWTHPGFFWPSPAATQTMASAPESRPPTVPPPVQAAAPAASAAAPDIQAASEPPASPLRPAFDVVNVDPTGEAVIAGRAAPNATVELRDAGKTVGEARADASGQFVIIPPALTPGDHSLSLAAEAGAAASETSSVVAISVPQPEAKIAAPLAAAAAPAPSPPALAMRAPATPPPAAASRVVIQSVEADAAGGLVAKGSAGPNATVRFYLNGSNVADARTQSDGRWSLTIKQGMTPGGYRMRADEVNPDGASVVASADMPFDYPAGPAPVETRAPATSSPAPTIAPAAASAGQPSAPLAADVVVDLVQTALVRPGHTLWALSQNYYGDPTRYPVIYEANKWEIHNPNLIYPGEVFVVPKSEPKP
ncbi:MAG TPA: Ig-like domain-containing protein [Roseiarcus sp.]|jgi:nucleoid-associated protein YgaU